LHARAVEVALAVNQKPECGFLASGVREQSIQLAHANSALIARPHAATAAGDV
jgi:hypothetical protein